MNDEIQPLGSRALVLVRVLEPPTVTSIGIVLPDTAKEKPQRGEIVAIGDDEVILEATDLLAVLHPAAVPA